jgi:hypothetical protein
MGIRWLGSHVRNGGQRNQHGLFGRTKNFLIVLHNNLNNCSLISYNDMGVEVTPPL